MKPFAHFLTSVMETDYLTKQKLAAFQFQIDLCLLQVHQQHSSNSIPRMGHM